MNTIGARIKARREELNMSQDELAQKLGYKSRSSINKIELGERNITQSKIKSFADALDTTPSYIMGWTGDLYSESQIELNNEMYAAIQEGKKWTWLDTEEQELIKAYRNFDEESKRQLVLMLAFLKDQNSKK